MNKTSYITQRVIYLEDKDTLRAMTADFLMSQGFDVVSFSSPLDLIRALPDILKGEGKHVALLDMRLDGELSGLDVFFAIRRQTNIPIIFLSGESRVSEAITALKAGAFDFLLKPIDMPNLVKRLREGFEIAIAPDHPDVSTHSHQGAQDLGALTRREKEVLDLLLDGHKGRETSEALSISERTVKMHRANAMKKLGAKSLAQLAATYSKLK